MKSISVNLQSHLNGPLTKLATCIFVTRIDGVEFGFTTHDKPLVIDSFVYEPAASFNPSDITSGNDLEVDNVSITGILSSDSITEDDLRAGRWDFATFRLFQVNWSNLSMGDKKDRKGTFGQVTVDRLTFAVELLGMMQAYTTSIGELTSPGCRANLGDARCGVVLSGGSPALGVTGTIDTAGTDFFSLTDTERAEEDGHFDGGVITFTSGQLDGLAFEVKTYTIGAWTTHVAMPYDASGATYAMTAGCDKRRETCRDRFNNIGNFRGEPWLRGIDSMVQVGRHS